MNFIARKYKELRLTVDPRIRIRDQGRSITKSLTGETQLGLTIEFHNGLFETKDPTIIAILKNHPRYGLDYISDERSKDANIPGVEAVAEMNEKKAVAEELRSTCTVCGAKFKTEFALQGHMRKHD